MSYEQGDTASYNVAGVIAINTVLLDLDVSKALYGLSIHCVSMGTTGVVTVEQTNDPQGLTGWTAVFVQNASQPGSGLASFNAAGIYLCPQNAKRTRFRLSTATTGGATTIYVTPAGAPPVFAPTQGPQATGSALSGNPVRSAGRASTGWPTARADNQLQELALTAVGQQVTKGFAPPELDWQFSSAVTGLATAADTAAKAAGAAGIRNYVTGVQLQNNSATASEFQIKDGVTVIWRCMCPANMPVTNVPFQTPLRGTAATALNVQAVTAASVVIANLQGYQAP